VILLQVYFFLTVNPYSVIHKRNDLIILGCLEYHITTWRNQL